MMTCTIQITDYLAEYLSAKYDPDGNGYVRFRQSMFIYMSIYNALRHKRERPEGYQESGNFKFVIPVPTLALHKGGKRAEYYNYVPLCNVEELEKSFRLMFWGDCHEFIDRKHNVEGCQYNVAIQEFLKKYKLTSITEEAVWKHYSRFKAKRANMKKREYTRKRQFYNPRKFK